MNHILLFIFLVFTSATVLGAPPEFDRVIGICHLSENPYDPTSAVNSMSVSGEAIRYLRKQGDHKIESSANVRVLQMPAHGKLLDGGKGNYAYLPEKDYIGNDRATLMVEVGARMIRMEYFFIVMEHVPDSEGINPYSDYCPKKVRVWSVSHK